MSKRLISSVRGFVHDIGTVASLSDTFGNIRLLSDRSLYILQNLSGKDVTFLSRYGDILEGGYYNPVEEGTPEAEQVYDAINLVRRDLTNMTVEDTLQCICDQLGAIAGAISAAQDTTCGCTIGTDVETTDGQEGGPLPDPVNGIEYEEPEPIVNRKCKAANYIHGGIKDVVEELKLNRADQYGFAGLAFVLSLVTTVVGGLIAGPLGLLLGAVVGSFLAMATMLFKGSFSLTILLTAIEADEQEAICLLYEATTASGARTAYLGHLDTHGATSVELEFIGYMLTNNLLNLLFFEWGDSAEAIDNATIIHSCEGCVVSPLDWIIMTDGFFPLAQTTATGLLGSGVINQTPMEEWTITAEERTDFPGQWMLGIAIRDYWDVNGPTAVGLATPPVTVLPNLGLEATAGGVPGYINSWGKAFDNCAGPIIATPPGSAVPNTYTSYGLLCWVASSPFSITFRIRQAPTACP